MMQIEPLPYDFSVCRVADYSLVDPEKPFCFIGKTDGESSLACLTSDVPANTTAREDGWRAMRFVGVLDFSLIGILAGASAALASHGIGIFAVSTFNTDYILVKKERFPEALSCLAASGYEVGDNVGAFC